MIRECSKCFCMCGNDDIDECIDEEDEEDDEPVLCHPCAQEEVVRLRSLVLSSETSLEALLTVLDKWSETDPFAHAALKNISDGVPVGLASASLLNALFEDRVRLMKRLEEVAVGNTLMPSVIRIEGGEE